MAYEMDNIKGRLPAAGSVSRARLIGRPKEFLKRFRWWIIAMAILIVVAVILGAVLGTRAQQQSRPGGGEMASIKVSSPGQPAVVPSWTIDSTARVGDNLASLSQPAFDASSWHRISLSKCTLMGCLLHGDVNQNAQYDDKDLFFSSNLKTVDANQFRVPWIYRHGFSVNTTGSKHFFLETNGITSRADIWLNGQQLADKNAHAGAYAGLRFDITRIMSERNALAIKVYPTNYNYDFALGFVDWNPYPADNGTGIWRDVILKQTGPVALDVFRISTNTSTASGEGPANVTLKAILQNLETRPVSVAITGLVQGRGSNLGEYQGRQSMELGPLQAEEVTMTFSIPDPRIWWPRQWGEQPLYTAQLNVSSNGTLSDASERRFGIRTVTSQVNSHNDTIFFVNGQPFQVIGGGYSADMFLRWDPAKFEAQAQYMLDLGHNTVRLEGKQEHPELYDIADRLGLMVMAGWECCDKWEAWSYNRDLPIDPVPVWSDADYQIANASMRHEALMMQNHPSMLAFLVGSDYWPDDRATSIYVEAFRAADWQVPIIASAAKRGYPSLLGPSGMKMEGPYDWVPPNYWYDTADTRDRKGAAFGFGSELGAGVGTPELGSLRRFLNSADMDDLWKEPNKGLFHMSNEGSQFWTREIYNDALIRRHGRPTSLDDYLLKAQMLDYEATRAQFEGFASRWSANRPATGLIYWMLNNAWPSLHWNLFDYYLHPGGSYFGAKVGARVEHVAYDYVERSVYLINRSLDRRGARTVEAELLGLDGRVISTNWTALNATEPNSSRRLMELPALVRSNPLPDVSLLRLVLRGEGNATLSRNVYWLAGSVDALDWRRSTWYHTPVTAFADFSALDGLQAANISVVVSSLASSADGGELRLRSARTVTLENRSSRTPAFFIRLNLEGADGGDVTPVFWSDNYVTLWPGETLKLEVWGDNTTTSSGRVIAVSGKNVAGARIPLP